MATIRIKNLKVRTIIGTNDWERDTPQDIIINIRITFDAAKACKSDRIEDTIDYKALKKKIMAFVEQSRYYLLEKLTAQVLRLVMENPRVEKGIVRIDKPLALRYADSVSLELEESRVP